MEGARLLPKLGAAFILGTIVGLECQRHLHTAGLRTNVSAAMGRCESIRYRHYG